MKNESSSSPAFVFIGFAILAFIAIAAGFYFGGQTGYAIASISVAFLLLAVGVMELIDAVFVHPLINVLLTIFPDDSEDPDC